MRGLLLSILACAVAFGVTDDWAKVKALKTGAEIRVYKKGSMQPVTAQMDELTDDNLVILVKKTETAIPRDQIDRIDARPASGRPTKQTITKESTKAGEVAPEVPGSSTSTSVSWGSKPDFETVYRRPVGAPKK
jgi:hypothetical protein